MYNLNDEIKIELAPLGVQKIVSSGCFKCSVKYENEIPYFIGPLWEVMQVFGDFMYHGNPNLPFKSMNFVFIKPYKKGISNE